MKNNYQAKQKNFIQGKNKFKKNKMKNNYKKI